MEAVSVLGCCIFTVYMFLPKDLIELNARSRFVSKALSSGFLYGGNLIGRALSLPAWSLPIQPPFFMLPQVKAHQLCTGKRFTLGKLMETGKRAVTMDRILTCVRGGCLQPTIRCRSASLMNYSAPRNPDHGSVWRRWFPNITA